MRDRRSFGDGLCWVELVIAGRKSEEIQRADEVQMLTQRERKRQTKGEKMRVKRKMKRYSKFNSMVMFIQTTVHPAVRIQTCVVVFPLHEFNL